MTEAVKHKPVFSFCFQIWITGGVFGPIMSSFWDSPTIHSVGGFLSRHGSEVIIGLLFSAPGILLFSGATAVLFRRPWPIGIKRLILSLLGIGLVSGMFGLFFQAPFSLTMKQYPGSILYIIPCLLGVWFYRWPDRMR